MMDAVTKLRQFHSTTPVWAKEYRAVLLASADHIEAQAERIRVLREALHRADEVLGDMGCNQTSAACRSALEATQ